MLSSECISESFLPALLICKTLDKCQHTKLHRLFPLVKGQVWFRIQTSAVFRAMFYTTQTLGVFLLVFVQSQYLRLLIFQVILTFTSYCLSWFMLSNCFFGQLCCSCSSSSSKFFPYALIKWGLRTSCQNIHPSNPLGASESQEREICIFQRHCCSNLLIFFAVCAGKC